MKHAVSLPELPYIGNEKSKVTFHLFLQIIGKIRLKLTPRKNHWWYITEYVDTNGFTTGPIFYNSGKDTFTISIKHYCTSSGSNHKQRENLHNLNFTKD